MNRQEKSAVIDYLRSEFEESQAIFVVSYKGLTVPLVQSLRRELRKHHGSFKVAKGRLMKRAMQGLTDVGQLESYCKNQIGLVFAEKDSPAVAKVIVNFSKENAALQVLVGYFDAKLIDSYSVQRIASIPSREVLLARLCGTLKAPMVKLVIVINQIATRSEDTQQTQEQSQQ